ncbi:MAG: hypothetical protein JWN04_2591 [Myxococcaceae bacterium]|nr:hypothetical protein [Myxococcaceae bacterium]
MTSATANAVALDSAGRLALAGSAEDANFNSSFALARLTTSGALDRTFDGDGKVFTTGIAESIADLKLQADGKIVVGGSGSSFIKGARYKTDGSVDTLFNTINIP